MDSVTASALSEVADTILMFCPVLLIVEEAEDAADERARADNAVLARTIELQGVVESVTCLGNTAVSSVPLLPIDVDGPVPIMMGISVVSGNKTDEEVDLDSGEAVVVSSV